MSVRLPASAMTSLALHAGFFGAYLYAVQRTKKEQLRVISNVGLIVQVKRPVALPRAMPKAATPPSSWNFLKLALPTIPRAAAPQTMQVKLPEIKKTLMAEPEKLKDLGRLQKEAKIEALELDRKRIDAVKIESKFTEKTRTAALASLPRLEEVGTRRVRNLPQAVALEERRQEAVALQQIGSPPPSGRRVTQTQVMDILREATPAERGALGDKMLSVLPAGGAIDMQPQRVAAPVRPAFKEVAPTAPARRQASVQDAEKKKSLEIEGPLANRSVVSYDVPAFPDWAKSQRILEAEAAIRFFVSPAGDVLPGMRVERSSGYGRLDRLCMDALKNWKFAPIAGGERQWGVITFRFLLE